MTALVKLTIHKDADVLKVPLAALRFRPEGSAPRDPAASTVWVRAADGSLEAVRVETGATSADLVALRAGSRLAEGSEVVVGQAEVPAERRMFGVRLGF
ncbi:hypothetical protein FOHLNKBM_6378 [Methylobacterium longum]|nr:hypothetical protein FOHLNKBM_6378 [Methylobacterium longum]